MVKARCGGLREIVTCSAADKDPLRCWRHELNGRTQCGARCQLGKTRAPAPGLRKNLTQRALALFHYFYRFHWVFNSTYTSVTFIPASFSACKSAFRICLSVITSWTAVIGMMLQRLRRPNLLESQTAIVRRAMSTMARFTSDSNKFGVKRPALVSKPSTPRNKMSAL